MNIDNVDKNKHSEESRRREEQRREAEAAFNMIPIKQAVDVGEGMLYNSSLRQLLPMFIIGYIASVFLIYQGFQGLRIYPAETGDAFRYIAGFVPLILGAVIIIALTALLIKNHGRRVGLSKTYFLYRSGYGGMKKMTWKTVSISTPIGQEMNFFSVAIITDGKTSVQIEKCFFPDFIEICQNIHDLSKVARRSK
ncbi:MAG: hypothetical protein Q4F00_02670 [bacterium]|nr:hypothetical protein [bacterium]